MRASPGPGTRPVGTCRALLPQEAAWVPSAGTIREGVARGGKRAAGRRQTVVRGAREPGAGPRHIGLRETRVGGAGLRVSSPGGAPHRRVPTRRSRARSGRPRGALCAAELRRRAGPGLGLLAGLPGGLDPRLDPPHAPAQRLSRPPDLMGRRRPPDKTGGFARTWCVGRRARGSRLDGGEHHTVTGGCHRLDGGRARGPGGLPPSPRRRPARPVAGVGGARAVGNPPVVRGDAARPGHVPRPRWSHDERS